MSIYINPETTDFYELGYKKRQEEMLANDIPKAKAEGKAETLRSLLTIKFGLINKDYDQVDLKSGWLILKQIHSFDAKILPAS